MNFCNVCGRKLTSPESIARGVGPVCGGGDHVCTLPFSAGLQRLTDPIDYDIELVRTGDGNVVTNVPWSVIHHSPNGFEWGYMGSGPADLALNILNAFAPPGSDGQPAVKCFEGFSSYTASMLHQEFKNHFLVGLPEKGGTITADDIKEWIDDQQLVYPEQRALL